MQQLNIFGETKPETSPGLAKLWDVIGFAGSRLDRSEKAQFISCLAPLGAWYADNTNLWEVMQWDYEESYFSEFPNTKPPLNFANFEEILGAIILSKMECWQAVTEIAAAQLETEQRLIAEAPKWIVIS